MQPSKPSALPVISVVLLGKKDSGKSTLINMIPNLLMGRQYLDERLIAIPHSMEFQRMDESGSDKVDLQCNIPAFKYRMAQSGPSEQCEFYGFNTEDCRLVLLDTPGMIDTSSPFKDSENTHNIVNAIGSMGEIHGIVIVHNGNETRVDPETLFMIGEIACMYPKAVKENVYVVLTHHAGGRDMPKVMDVFKSAGIVPKKVFTFDNGCFIPKDIMDRYDKYETPAEIMSRSWNRNKTSFDNLFRELKSTIPVKTTDFKLIASQRAVMFDLGSNLCDILMEINDAENNLIDLKIVKDGLVEFKESYENATKYYYIDVQELEKIINAKPPRLVTREVPSSTKSFTGNNIIKCVEVPMPEGQQSLICFTCKYSCEENCKIRSREKDGRMEYAAFNNSPQLGDSQRHEICLKCNHSYEYHGYRKYKYERKLPVQESKFWKLETKVHDFIDIDDKGDARIYDIRSINGINPEFKQRYEDVIKDIEHANQNIAKAEPSSKNLDMSKNSIQNIIVHLFHKIQSICNCPLNTYYENHINAWMGHTKNSISTEITDKEKRKMIARLTKLLQTYKNIFMVVKSSKGSPTLTREETTYANDAIAKIFGNDEKIFKEYGKKYHAAATLEALDCRI